MNLMKNVTITMEDAVADWVRVEAAKRNTSVSRMLGEMVAQKMRHNDAYAASMREALRATQLSFEGPFLSRDEIYAERLNRFR